VSWIDTPPERAYPWHVRAFLAFLASRGRLSQSVRLWARAPRAFLSFLRLFKAIDRDGSPLESPLRALVMVRVSQLTRCDFCDDLNRSRALERGVTAEQLEALEHHAVSPLFGAREKAALAFADAVTATGAPVPPAVRQAVRTAFTDDAIVELSALVAFQNMSSRFNAALDVPAEGFCKATGRQRAPCGVDR
jgi:AhpD family alkylhydroperoxidase